MAVSLTGDEAAEGQRCVREGELEPSQHAYGTGDQCGRGSSWKEETCAFSPAVEQSGI